MAKARSRTAARKVKDKWKAKTWYNVLAPESFDHVTVSETLADETSKLMNRITEVSLQDITNDFRKSHVKLFFEVCDIEGTNAHTQFIGHTLTSDYLRRMIRRKRSKIDGVYDVVTKDGARVRIKPFATTDRRIQTSQKKVIRDIMKNTINKEANASTLSEFIKIIIDGKIGSEIYKSCKKIYPVKRIEIYKTHVISQPTTKIEEPKKAEIKEKAKGKENKKQEKESKELVKVDESLEIIETDGTTTEPKESIDQSEDKIKSKIKKSSNKKPSEEKIIEEEFDEKATQEKDEEQQSSEEKTKKSPKEKKK